MMPAMLDDPDSPTIYRTTGSAPFPDPHHPSLPVDVYPRQVTLRDRVTIATVVPFSSQHQVPASLLAYLTDQLNKEIEMGDTYPMIDTMSVEKFSSYWFQNFGAVMLLGNIEHADDVIEGKNWATECLGSFYIKPNYPGRSSHVCNAGFLVTDAARNRGVGRLMGETYLEWAPRIGYTYSVFNLVYETNVASCRIWDALGFKRIGRVKGAGNLKSYPGQLIDAIVYGRDLGPEGEDFVSEERFDKIKFYLKYGKYPNGADRAEKSRLRSAATHYKLLDNGKLMLKDKEVISDPQRQYEIARNVHVLQHGGINKTTATIAEKFHWVRIKETVSLVIRNCAECKELGKAPIVRGDGVTARRANVGSPGAGAASTGQGGISAAGRILSLPQATADDFVHSANASVSPQVLNRSLPDQSNTSNQSLQSHPHSQNHLQPTSPHQLRHHHAAPIAQMQDGHLHHHHHHHHHHQDIQDDYMPLDPQIMEDVRQHLGNYNQHVVAHHHHHDPSFSSPHDHDHDLDGHDGGSEQHDSDSFQAMLGATGQGNHDSVGHADGDLDMLIDEEEEEDEGLIVVGGGREGDVEVDDGSNNDTHGDGASDDHARSGNLAAGDDLNEDDDNDATAIIKEARVAVEEAARAAEEAMRSGEIGKGDLFHHRHDERYGSV